MTSCDQSQTRRCSSSLISLRAYNPFAFKFYINLSRLEEEPSGSSVALCSGPLCFLCNFIDPSPLSGITPYKARYTFIPSIWYKNSTAFKWDPIMYFWYSVDVFGRWIRPKSLHRNFKNYGCLAAPSGLLSALPSDKLFQVSRHHLRLWRSGKVQPAGLFPPNTMILNEIYMLDSF
jgi:hypothetical protein